MPEHYYQLEINSRKSQGYDDSDEVIYLKSDSPIRILPNGARAFTPNRPSPVLEEITREAYEEGQRRFRETNALLQRRIAEASQ